MAIIGNIPHFQTNPHHRSKLQGAATPWRHRRRNAPLSSCWVAPRTSHPKGLPHWRHPPRRGWCYLSHQHVRFVIKIEYRYPPELTTISMFISLKLMISMISNFCSPKSWWHFWCYPKNDNFWFLSLQSWWCLNVYPKVDEFWGLSPQVDGSSMFIPLDLMISHLYPQSWWWFINVYIL